MNSKGKSAPLDQVSTEVNTGRSPAAMARRFPIGGEPTPGGGAHFRVWAPKSERVAVELSDEARFRREQKEVVELEPEAEGYFSAHLPEARAGMLYKFRLNTGSFPDPASRFQPDGPHGPSQVVNPERFNWTDQEWKGVPRAGQVVYEMHIGTFTEAGTWAAATAELPELKRLGISVVELMPVSDFTGRFGWGYDGVDLFAPTRL